ncbi:MAG: hypothetical protein WBU92_11795, partial [Candidatus Dormiibacterota bacterium]
LLLAADRDRRAFGDFQRAQRQGGDVATARQAALATPGEIGERLAELEARLRELTTTPSLDLDRRLAVQITAAAREAVQRLQREFSKQA